MQHVRVLARERNKLRKDNEASCKMGGHKKGEVQRRAMQSCMYPTSRYVQRLLSCSLFGRTEANTITLEELYMMLRPFFEEIPVMNLKTLLAQNLTSVKHYAHSKKGTWQTSAHRGIITPIMKSCGTDLSICEAIRGQKKIDLDYLHKIHFIKGWVGEAGKLCFNCQDRMRMRGIILLSNKDLTKLTHGVVNFNPREVFTNLGRDQIHTIRDHNKIPRDDGEDGESEQRSHHATTEKMEKANSVVKMRGSRKGEMK